MSNKRVKGVLKGQEVPPDPTITIMRGAVARLDYMVEAINLLEPALLAGKGEEDGGVSATLLDWKHGTEEFLTELAVARLFRVMILKLQRPIVTNEEQALYLVYNKDRSLCEQMSVSPEVDSFFKEGELKVFVVARLWNDGVLQLVTTAEWQDW